MCNFHSICVRKTTQGIEIIHNKENSHSLMIEKFKWNENDSKFKKKRFIEAEWDCYGEYPGAEKICRFDKEEGLDSEIIKSVNKHYVLVKNALSGDPAAFNHFLETPEYEDVVSETFQRILDPSLLVKLLCDKAKIIKRVEDHIASGAPASTAGDYAFASTAGYCAPASTAGYCAPASTAGDYAFASTAGDYAFASTAGNYAPASTAGNYAPASTAGDYAFASTAGYCAPASTAGEHSIAACLGNNGKAKAGKNGSIALTYWDNTRFRIKVGYVGEDLEQNQWYTLDNKGNFIKTT
jgi:hypothetical protein